MRARIVVDVDLNYDLFHMALAFDIGALHKRSFDAGNETEFLERFFVAVNR